MGTGNGWSAEESLIACKAYVRTSEDSVKGNGQKGDFFSAAVYDNYEQSIKALHGEWLEEENLRSAVAVSARFKKVRKEGLKFDGIVHAIKRLEPTGEPTAEDIINAATAVYNKVAEAKDMYNYFLRDNTNRREPWKAFPFIKELLYLRTTELWRKAMESRSKCGCGSPAALTSATAQATASNANPGYENAGNGAEDDAVSAAQASSLLDDGQDTDAIAKRPTGNKRAIAITEQRKSLERGAKGIESMADAAHKRLKLLGEMVKTENKKVDVLKEKAAALKVQAHMKLFSASLADADPDMQTYLRAMRRQVLSSMNTAEVNNPQNSNEPRASQEPHSSGDGSSPARSPVFGSMVESNSLE